jgi:predicted methyltransferase
MNDCKEVTQAIAELIRLHDDVLARVFAVQTILQDLGLVSPNEVQLRTEELRRDFAKDLEARLAALEKKTDSAGEIQHRQQILDEFEGRDQ